MAIAGHRSIHQWHEYAKRGDISIIKEKTAHQVGDIMAKAMDEEKKKMANPNPILNSNSSDDIPPKLDLKSIPTFPINIPTDIPTDIPTTPIKDQQSKPVIQSTPQISQVSQLPQYQVQPAVQPVAQPAVQPVAQPTVQPVVQPAVQPVVAAQPQVAGYQYQQPIYIQQPPQYQFQPIKYQYQQPMVIQQPQYQQPMVIQQPQYQQPVIIQQPPQPVVIQQPQQYLGGYVPYTAGASGAAAQQRYNPMR